MVENRSGTPLEPSPNFDCHLLKTLSIDMSAASPQYVYECTQVRRLSASSCLDLFSPILHISILLEASGFLKAFADNFCFYVLVGF